MAQKLTVKIVGSTKGIVVDESGKSWEVAISFHARRLGGEYKYHEVYVYLNKLDEFKAEFKAPKTLKQKWCLCGTGKWKSLGQAGVKIAGYEEVINRTSSRASYDLFELEYE